MPLLIIPALYVVLRYLLMALLTGIVIDLALSILNKATDVIIEWLKEEFDLSDDDALIIIANHVVDILITTGTIYGLIKLKIPTKFAQRLGLTSGGYVKKAISAEGIKKMTGKVVTEKAKASLKKKMIAAFGISFATSLPWLPSLIENTTEVFVYAGRDLNYLLKRIGAPSWLRIPIRPTQERIIPFTKESWPAYLAGLKTQNIAGLNDTFIQQTRIFSENALVEIVESLYGKEIADGRKPTEKQMIALLAPFLIKTTGNVSFAPEQTGAIKAPIQPIKVFTGIVSQGTLGAPTEFTPRENDLIESVDELKDSAQNNLAPFITALPGKIIYEIKIVSSVTTRDGFRRTGEAQKVLSKYTAAGVPLYKTVVNKFAVLDIFIMTDKLSKAKISSIVLGPTDAIKLQPTANVLAGLQASIKQDLFTSNISDITGIQTAQPITITTPPAQPAETIIAPTPALSKPQYKITSEMYISREGFDGYLYKATPEQVYQYRTTDDLVTPTERATAGSFGASAGIAKQRLLEFGINVDAIQRVSFFDTLPSKITSPQKAINSFAEFFGPATMSPTPVSAKPASSACLLQTLYEWYTAQGQSLPSVGQRATLYESLGLGLASYYVGTSEQNTKLLTSLKRNNGCNV